MTLPFLWDEKIVRQISGRGQGNEKVVRQTSTGMGYGGRPFGDHNLLLIGCAVAGKYLSMTKNRLSACYRPDNW